MKRIRFDISATMITTWQSFLIILTIVLIMVASLLVGGGNDRSSYAAPMCQQWGGHKICILTIKRSAKNYWEYRASVKIDEQRYPVEVYNCRDRTKTLKTGQIVPFIEQSAGTLICTLLYR